MKKIFLLTILIVVFSSGYAQNTFRNTSWGMTKEQVKAVEKNKILMENSTEVYYEVILLGQKTTLMYVFHKNKLFFAIYILVPSDTQNISHKKTETQLTEKYGELITYKQDNIHTRTTKFWMDKNTQIELGGNDDIIMIKYIDRRYALDKVKSILYNNSEIENIRGVKFLSNQLEVKKHEAKSILLADSNGSSLSYIFDKEWATGMYLFNNNNELISKSVSFKVPFISSLIFYSLIDSLSEKYGKLDATKRGRLYPIGYTVLLPDNSKLTIESDEKMTYVTISQENIAVSKINSDL